ncbi:hypothetical protein Nepgr_006826 [Nepenthes gracilis]|uniref:BUB1 N-terminal domain-containing protein n=1 Tax=Nepenthes gracilis TaxID=150966 RepID=A0AAD3S698_NEPGR|nr:hypothetical protein Nepgr_006826 [Nepenthes gracilis]
MDDGGKRERESEMLMVDEDPETVFLKTKQQKTGGEWEMFKENVRPLKRGRNVKLLNDALKSHSHMNMSQLKNSLLQTRRKLVEAIDEYKGDDPLNPWLECIKWVQDAFPAGGECSGLVILYEQCVRTFWHSDQYKNDLRYLKVWLEYADNCADAEVIYSFLEANEIGQTYSAFYIAYALHMESKKKIKTANDIFNRGLSINAQPQENLEAAYRKFLAQSMTKPKALADKNSTDNCLPIRSFGSVLSRRENRRHASESSDASRDDSQGNRGLRVPLSIYKDINIRSSSGNEVNMSKTESGLWDSLSTQAERNKENKAVPAKWTSHKIPQRPGHRTGGSATTYIEVFVDDECSGVHQTGAKVGKSSSLQLREGTERDLKRETELLREDPLRNFPISSLPSGKVGVTRRGEFWRRKAVGKTEKRRKNNKNET